MSNLLKDCNEDLANEKSSAQLKQVCEEVLIEAAEYQKQIGDCYERCEKIAEMVADGF